MLEASGASRQADGGPLWVGIDSWAVDYGLIDGDGHLLGPPFHYRDERTAGRMEEADRRLGPGACTRQRASSTCRSIPSSSSWSNGERLLCRRLQPLMVPDLLAYLLTGQRRFEHTNASTTQLVDTRTGELIAWLLTRARLRKDLFADPVKPAEHYGPVLAGVAASVEMKSPGAGRRRRSVPRHRLCGAGVPALSDGFAYVICGTWSLVGLELDAPVIDDASRRANFSNELGYDGTVRFLKNVMGFWMLQECERCWALEGRSVPLVDLLAQAERCEPFRSLVDTSRPDFAVPCDMPERIAGCLPPERGARAGKHAPSCPLCDRQRGDRRLCRARRSAALLGEAGKDPPRGRRGLGQPPVPVNARRGQRPRGCGRAGRSIGHRQPTGPAALRRERRGPWPNEGSRRPVLPGGAGRAGTGAGPAGRAGPGPRWQTLQANRYTGPPPDHLGRNSGEVMTTSTDGNEVLFTQAGPLAALRFLGAGPELVRLVAQGRHRAPGSATEGLSGAGPKSTPMYTSRPISPPSVPSSRRPSWRRRRASGSSAPATTTTSACTSRSPSARWSVRRLPPFRPRGCLPPGRSPPGRRADQ